MPKQKPNKPRLGKPDGRTTNGRKPGTVVKKQPKMTPAKMNKAKKDRLSVYSVNSIIHEFGSEEEFTNFLAKEARGSFNHLKLLMDYAYGRPEDQNRHVEKKQAPTIVFVNNDNQKGEQTIEVSHQESEDE